MIPWWAKIGAKLVLSRLPVPYAVWRRIGVFRHGSMTDPEVAIDNFLLHWRSLDERRPGPGFAMLELGPGDSVLSAGVARAHGAACSVLVDRGSYAVGSPALFAALDAALERRGLPRSGGGEAADPLAAVGGRYETGGLGSLQAMPAGSFDLIWSGAVLEHVALGEMPALLAELRRLLKSGGIMSHQVDYRDHLGGGLAHLRFGHERWESAWWREAGFYTNRIAPSELGRLLHCAGFETHLVQERRRAGLPMLRARLAPSFRDRSDDDLLVEDQLLHAW